MKIVTHKQLITKDLDSLNVSKFWSESRKAFSPLHNIHVYPAKFPAFLVDKSIHYAKKKKINIEHIADIFCGCGTTALESSLRGYNFWGIDTNPVATLVTKVKVNKYQHEKILYYLDLIIKEFSKSKNKKAASKVLKDERINYWFEEEKIKELFNLKKVIVLKIKSKKYRNFFLCAFSNILKKTSRWLQKSIKPTIDNDKKTHPVLTTFINQVNMMSRAILKTQYPEKSNSKSTVKTGSILSQKIKKPLVDLLLTSPPYVTSYEYADLHQLSSLWLDYAKDFRSLRKGSIGSTVGVSRAKESEMNEVGKSIVDELEKRSTKQAKSVSRYFADMKKAISKGYDLIKPGGIGVIIIGNTEYSGVKIDNAKYLAYELLSVQAENIVIYKREIGTKFLTRYRSKDGRFSQAGNNREIYHCEFVITFQRGQKAALQATG